METPRSPLCRPERIGVGNDRRVPQVSRLRPGIRATESETETLERLTSGDDKGRVVDEGVLGEAEGEPQIPRLRSPGFPVELGGVAGPHAPFLKRKAHTQPGL